MGEALEKRELLASDTILIASSADLIPFYDASTNSYSIGDEKTSAVTIADGIVIDTSSTTGPAGNVTVQAHQITIGSNVQILANGPIDSVSGHEQDGAITFQSENVMQGVNVGPAISVEDLLRLFQDQSSTITIGASTVIDGGAITMSTASGNELVGDFLASQIHEVSKIVLEYKHKPDLLALPVSIQVWEPKSEIVIGSEAKITSSSEVSLDASAAANAFGKAVWNSLKETTGASPTGFAFGQFFNRATATITVSSNATIAADEDIEIQTDVDNVTELEVASIKNLGVTQTNPKANSFAWGSAEVITVSTITLDTGSLVQSAGNVTIEATAKDENTVSTKATSYRDGFVTIAGAFTYSNATVTVDVNGTVISGNANPAPIAPAPLIFNPAFVVDFATNSLMFEQNLPYQTGDKLLFDSADGSTIPGLIPGSIYYAIVNPATPKWLQLALSAEDALQGKAIALAANYPTLSVSGYELPIVVVDSVYSNTMMFAYDNIMPGTTNTPIFTNGQLVNYSPAAGQFLGANDANGNLIGALPAGQYTVKIVASPQPDLFPLAIQLADQAGLLGAPGNVVVLNTNSFFTAADGSIVQVASTDVQTSQISLNFATPPDSQDGQVPLPTPSAQTPTQATLFTNSQPLIFTSGLGNQIGNLVNGQTYWAVVDPSTPGVIRLASNYEQSVAANPVIQDAVPQLKTVSNQDALQSVANSFTDADANSFYALQANNSYTLWNNADGGTFAITLLGPDGAVTTPSLAWNISAADLQSALNHLSGIVATVSGQGTLSQPWVLSILFQFEIGNVEPGTGLVFTSNPNLADGSPLVYLGNPAKPIAGLTLGSTYYAYNTANPSFDADLPQYVLNLRATADPSTPVIAYQLVQSMTDSQGVNYDLLASIASQNLLTLALSSSVAVQSIDDSLLVGGTASSQTLAANTATTLFSFADSGTFALIVTDSLGNAQTASTLAFDASASQVAAALNALAGVSVQVTGLGTLESPWTVIGLADQTLSADSSLLRSDGLLANILFDDLVVDAQQVWTDASGGTFTLSLIADSQIFTTAPIAYNATASQVQQSIEQIQVVNGLPVIRSSVSGSGTEEDPWQISMWYQSIQTGDALTFSDSWLLNGLGLINGQTYYAVISPSQFSQSGVTLSLASSYELATASTPTVVTTQQYLLLESSTIGLMVGSQMGFDYQPEDAGVTIRATLEASDSASMASSIGLFPMLGYYLNYGKNELDGEEWKSGVEKEIEEKLAPEVDDSLFGNLFEKNYGKFDETHPFEISLGFSLVVAKNNVAVTIGSNAVIESQGSVTIDSEIEHLLHTFAASGTARTTGSGRDNKAVGVALAMSFIDNTSHAIIQSNAQVSGATGVSIASNIDYPFAWKQTTISEVHNGGLEDDWKSKAAAGTTIAENVVTNALFSNAFGVSNWLFNDSTNVDAMPGDGKDSQLDFALSGSILFKNIVNDNLAQICDGARINQSTNVQAQLDQGLELTAETNMDQVSMAGQMILGLNLGWLTYARNTKGGLGENYNFIVGLTDAKTNVGGSFNFSLFNNSTQAIIGETTDFTDGVAPSGATAIGFGNEGLKLDSSTQFEFIPLAQSGGISSGFGLEASVAVVDVNSQTTRAAILDATIAPSIQANQQTNGEIEIAAIDQSTLTPGTGGLFIGNAVNLGFSSSSVVLNREVNAFIGGTFAETTETLPQSSWANLLTSASVSIDAEASGKIIPVSIAGSIPKRTTEEKGKPVGGGKEDAPHFGFGVSGSYSEANITDIVQAYLNGAVLDLNSNELDDSDLTVHATNDTQTDLATGAAAFQREKGRDSGAGIAGAGSTLVYSSTVQAGTSNTELTAFPLSVAAKNAKDLGTFAAGLDGASIASTAIEVAGSAAINHVTNVTQAQIGNSTGSELGAISLSALEQDDVVAAAGTLTIVTSAGSESLGRDEAKPKVKVGFGFGFAQNLLDSTTHATIRDADLNQTDGGVNVDAEQASRSFVLSAGAVFEVGKGTGIATYGMVALNEYSDADVQALVQDSTITSSSDDPSAGMSIDSQLIPIMITAAGDLGLSIAYKTGPGATEASVGAGVSVTEVGISGNSLATIDQSTISLARGNLEVSAFTGQADDYSELTSTLTEINLPLGEYNLYSLAIAGGLSTAFSASGEMALGINGVGAGIGSSTDIATQAAISSDSTITLVADSATGGSLAISALENLNIYDDAGGASVSIAISDGDGSVGIAVGVGSAVHTSTNSVIASLESSTVTTSGDLTVGATSESEVKAIGFGVALNVSVATLLGVSFASSAAVAKIDSTDTISAYISGGTTTAGNDATDGLSVVALDQTNYYTAVGSGSLAVSGGTTGVSLASGASVSRIDPSHTISAYIGTLNPTSPVPMTTVTASGAVSVEATNQQGLTSEAIAVASSVAIGDEGTGSFAGAGASSRIETTNNTTAGILAGTALISTLQDPTSTAISIQTRDNANIKSTVGSAAAAFTISPVPIGGSLGISISEITNNDRATSLIQAATITTAGGDVVVQAKGTNNQSSKSVATSLSDGLGAAGAGGNSNIYDYSEFAASVDAGAAIDTSLVGAGSDANDYGSLSVLATSSETILAEVYGGSVDLGIGSVGVFYSNALRSGSTQANLTTAGIINVGDLHVEATTDQTVTSEGMSVTIGILAGSGEVHNVSVYETVGVLLDGSTGSSVTPWSVSGNLTVDATSQNNATAQTSGAGDGGAGVNVALLGAGGFKVVSEVSPTVLVSVTDASLTVAGTSLMKVAAQTTNEANTRSGSGSLIGANAAIAQTENNPTIALTTNDLQLTAASATFEIVNDLAYDMSTDSVYATLEGGSGASATNNSTPRQSLTLGTGTAISTKGSVVVSSFNTMAGSGAGSSLKANGFMANVGGGALVGGFGGLSTSDMNSMSTITLEDGVSITAHDYGNIHIGAQNSWDLSQVTHLSTGSAISGVGISSTVTSELDTSIQIGDGVVLKAPEGQVGIGTNISSLTSADSYARTFGLAGAVFGIVDNQMTANQTVSVGTNTTITAGEGIAITAGYNPLNQLGTQINAYAIVTSRVIGILDIPSNTYDSDLTAENTVHVGTGTNIISGRDVQIGSVKGTNNAVAYSFASIDGGSGKTEVETDGLQESNAVTLDGTIVAGQDHELAISIQDSAGSYSMSINGGSPQSVPNSVNGSLQTIEPSGNQTFVPFQVGFNSGYDPAQLLVGLDPTVQAVLSLSLSSTPVPAVSLDKLAAVGGRVLIEAGSLNGSGAVFAYAPEILLMNNSNAYLLLGSMTIPQTYGMGQIDLTGGATVPATLSLNQANSPPTISVTSTASGPVGNNAAGPALGLLGEITNTAGSVAITNDHGAFAQEGTVVAAAVTIDVPNASYIVNTPSNYFGTSGAIQEYWSNSVNLIPDGNFESPQWSNQGTSFTYNPDQLGWSFMSQSGISGNSSGFTAANPSAPLGSQVALVQNRGSISRVLGGLIPGSSYVLEFYAAQRANYSPQQVSLSIGSQNLGTITPSGTNYQLFSIPFQAPPPETTPVENTGVLTLTTGNDDTATAAWNPNLISIPTSGQLTFQFTYQASGDKAADGVAMVFQNQGIYALGQTGGALGYVGILGNTAAYQINLYQGHVQGSNFVTTNTAGTYLPTGPVSFSNGNPIRVTLVYDADAKTVSESLVDQITGATYSRTYRGIDLASVLGSTATFGFTGAEGASTSIQTISNFTMTVSSTTASAGFNGWGYVTPLELTITGLDPSGVDETMFIDGISLSQNTSGFTPGLNWYSPFLSTGAYSANAAASSAANALYGSLSGASNSTSFSNWLYNTSQIGISSFTNSNITSSDVGGNYPSKPSNNWTTTENGTGIMFFGSQIPYVWNSVTTISNPSLLTQSNGVSNLGFLDTLGNVQSYSAAASGNPNDTSLNVTQGTGPQNGTELGQRGVFPTVPFNVNHQVPTQATVVSPQSRSLGGSITAGNISVNALYIDINGPIHVGAVNPPVSVILDSTLQNMVAQYQKEFAAGTQLNPQFSINSYLGTSGLEGYYDALSQQLVLEPYAINAGEVAAIFNGGILSTTSFGNISLHSNPNAISIVNQTSTPMVLQGIAASATATSGVVEFQDTLSNTATAYSYTSSSPIITVYQGTYGATRDQMSLVSTSIGDTIRHTLDPNLTYQWTQDAYISRNLQFSNANENYELFSKNDNWSWGPLSSSGTAPSNYGVASNPFVSNPGQSPQQLILTDGIENDAVAFWYQYPVSIPTSGTYSLEFDYQAGGARAADGITLAFQTEGTNAVGNNGGFLGYVGIKGPTAAYQINIYNGHTIGSNFVTSNSSGSYLSTGQVSFNSGHTIRVQLSFNADLDSVTETLTDTETNATFSRTYTNVNLANLLGSKAFIGFTGGDGGATSIQEVSEFEFSSANIQGFDNFVGHRQANGVALHLPSTQYTQSLSSVITNMTTAKTTFSSNYKDAWNYGPSTTWTWTYPTEILLRLKNQLPAGNPIAIDFSGIGNGSLNVQSTNSSLYVAGNIQFPGSVNLVGDQGIFASAGGQVQAQSVQFEASSGTIGTITAPILFELTDRTPIDATASSGVFLSSGGDLLVGNIQAVNGPVVLASAGNIQGPAASSIASVMGTNIQLSASNGSIGTQSAPLVIQTQTSQLNTGTIIDGLLTASALDSVYLLQPGGELRLASVVTTAPLGTVSIINSTGNITDGMTQDFFELNGNNLSSGSIDRILEGLKQKTIDSVDATLDANEAYVNASYLNYWSIVDNSTNQNGQLVLTDQGINLFQNRADAYYGLPTLSAFSGWQAVGSNANSQKPTSLNLSNGSSNAATAVWNPQQIALPTTGGFEVGFLYQRQGTGINNGISMVFQTQGVSAVGEAGDALGYVGISGPTAAYQINLSSQPTSTPGSNFVLTNTSGTYHATGNVNFNSGNPIQVQLIYDAEAKTLTEMLQDTITFATFTRVYEAIDLTSLLGANAYLGFTGSDGQGSTTQTVSNFSYAGIASSSQVQSYANGVYANAVGVFEQDLVFGPGWLNLPPFAAYDPNYTFELSSTAASQLTEGGLTVSNVYAVLSLKALGPAGSKQLNTNVEPVISTSVLFLNAGGTIGRYQAPVEIQLDDFHNGELTPFQRALLTEATEAGELQLVGTDASGTRVVYSYGDAPQGVTPTAVIVKISRPLFVDVSQTGIAMLQANDAIYLTETSGSMNLLHAIAGTNAPVSLEAQSALQITPLQASTSAEGWSLNGMGTLGYTGAMAAWTPTSMTLSSVPYSTIVADALSLTAKDSIGATGQPLFFNATGPVDVFSLSSVWLQTDTPIRVREWTVVGEINLEVQGTNATTDALVGKRSSFEGFDSDAAGWTAAGLHGNTTVTTPVNGSEILTLNTLANSAATGPELWYAQVSYTKNASVQFSEKFLIGFTYQSAGTGGRLAINLENENQEGLALVLNLGAADGSGAWASFGDSAAIGTLNQGQSLGSVVLNSNHPILVVWSYDNFTQVSKATFTDTVTGQTVSISQSNVKWLERLGSRSAQVSWQAFGDGSTDLIQTISDFRLIDGQVNIASGSLNVQTGGSLGQPASLKLSQFDHWVSAGSEVVVNSDSLTLTDGSGNQANAFWYPDRLDLTSTGSFTVEFQYTAGGAMQADGITLALQTQGTNAVGTTGGGLGYAGITGPAVAYQINIYAGHVQGSNLVTTNTSGTYLPTGNVAFGSGHTIQVQLIFDTGNHTVTEHLTDTVNGNTFSRTYSDIDLSSLLGAYAYLGFTGGDGGETSIQTVSNFSLTSTNPYSESQPILIDIDHQVEIVSGGNIVAEQVLGDLQVGTISSGAFIDLTAPFGAIVTYAPPSGNGLNEEGETFRANLIAPKVELRALQGIGESSNPLQVIADRLALETRWNNLVMHHRAFGPETQSAILKLIAGGVVQFTSEDALSVEGKLIAESASFRTGVANRSIAIAIAELSDHMGHPLPVTLSGYQHLGLSDAPNGNGRTLSISQGIVDTGTSKLRLGDVQHLQLSLGNGDDLIHVLDASRLASLTVDSHAGHNELKLGHDAWMIPVVNFNGQMGYDKLTADLQSIGVWITANSISTATGSVFHTKIEERNLVNLEPNAGIGSFPAIHLLLEVFPANMLMLLGTSGTDTVAIRESLAEWKINVLWNGSKMERRTFSTSQFSDLQVFTLGGNDFVTILGASSPHVGVNTGLDDDWISVRDASATIEDLSGNNSISTDDGNDTIHTGAGDDEIDAASGKNQIRDDGGINSFTTGDDDDKIWHSNAADWIVAKEGINDIWLHEVHQGWHNKNTPMDVTRDGWVTALDALVLINKLNRTGSGYLLGSADSVQYLYDVSGDGYISPLDVLRTINWLNGNRGGEGESSAVMDTIEPVYGSSSDRAMLGRTSGVSLPGFAPIPSPSPITGIHEGDGESDALLFDRRETQLNANAEHHDAVFSNWNPSEWDDLSPFSRSRRNGKR